MTTITNYNKKKTKRWDATPQGQQPDALDRFMNQLESGTSKGVVQNDALQIDVGGSAMRASKSADKTSLYSPKDWLSDAPPEDEEEEETARRKLIEALLPSQEQKQKPVLKRNVRDQLGCSWRGIGHACEAQLTASAAASCVKMVCALSGPTERTPTGTPTNSSMRLT